MTRRTLFIFSIFISSLLIVSANPLSGRADDPAPVTCVKWTAEAKFVGLAYNHLVHLDNQCDFTASCRVKTNVNPKEETVVLKSKETKTHLTFRGSPAREFKAEVVCKKN
jgi:hypothetical protein